MIVLNYLASGSAAAKDSTRSVDDNGNGGDIWCYGAHGLAKGKVYEAIKILHDMEGLGIKPNAIICNSIMLGLCKAQLTSRAINYLAYMVAKGCKPTKVTYTIVIEGIAYERLVEEALEFLNELCSRGFMKKSST
ncbi:hypothetical protein VNO78_09426 [Psophocarpus tetragonolobus]|uniref:Pentatricopeptide repeat-containing protein n=1 Tax=Psophocarpus tetragonolobus TaxID=3891 RepID=A0AAN9SX09_PSOTE